MFNHWIRSLSVRLWVTTVVALASSLTVLAALVVYAFDHYPEQMLGGTEQAEKVRSVVAGLNFDAAGQPVSVRLQEQEAWLFHAVPTELMYRVLDEQGHLLLASAGARDGGRWLADGLSQVAGETVHTTIDGKRYAIVTQRISRGQAVFYVQTASSAQFIEALVTAKITPIPGVVHIVLLVAAIIFGLTLPLTIHRVLNPLRKESAAAAQITPRNLKTRLLTKGIPSEIKPLINAFNEALARLENGFAVQQRFLAAAAHELQTPLTLMRGHIELQAEIREKDMLFREIDLMSRQVRQLLHLAEVSETQNFSFEEVSCVDVAQDVMAYLASKADGKQVKLKLRIDERRSRTPTPIWADRSALFMLLKNVVENAINVSPANGVVSIMIDKASIEIRDEGPGIRPDHLPFLFERFWRAPDAGYDGAGLGLAICKEIALAHDWRLTVTTPAIGTRFTVWL